jgi:hypothetical protein
MAGLGKKTFSPGDVLTSSDVQNYLMDQSVMVFAGTAARASAIPSPSAGMVAYSTATGLQLYNGTAWVAATTGYGVATGGSATSITQSGVNYTLLTFSTSATLTISTAGLFDLALVGGGASGGLRTAADLGAGGGGAGGLIQTTVYFAAGTQTITVGAKGAAVTTQRNGNTGTATSINTLAAIGGGQGGAGSNDNLNGASGGGSFGNFAGSSAIAGNQGKGGGVGGYATNLAGGGGGGYASVGGNNSGNTAGSGGTGYDLGTNWLGGASAFFCGGGGGGSRIGTGGAGGSSVGGAGSSGAAAGSNASPASRGSGGGGGQATTSGAGSDGVAYVRFKV